MMSDHARPLHPVCVLFTLAHTNQNKKQEAARHAELLNERVSVSLFESARFQSPGQRSERERLTSRIIRVLSWELFPYESLWPSL